LSDENNSIFREVDDEVRQEEYKKLWDRYGKHLGVAGLVFIAAIAGWQGWKYYQIQQSQQASVIYYDALKIAANGKSDDALAALAAVNHAGFGQLAKLEVAGIFGTKGDTEKAVAAYDAFAADAANDPSLADLARIRAGYLLVDTQSPDQLLTRLGRYDKDGVLWHLEAREIFGLSAWRVKDYAMADRYFRAIEQDPKATPSIKQRAAMLLQLITPNLPPK